MTTMLHTDDLTLGDMNGPLAYWGPAHTSGRPATARSQPVTTLGAGEREVLARLSETLHGRTWAGTSALMADLFASVARETAAIGRPASVAIG